MRAAGLELLDDGQQVADGAGEPIETDRLVDLRGDGPVRMGVPSDVARGSAQLLARQWSVAFHAHPSTPDGIIYMEADALYTAARELGLQCPNVFFLLSAKRDTHIESDLIAYRAAGAPWRHNLAVASDAPYGRVCWNFGGFRAMFECLSHAEGHSDPRLSANPGLFDPDTVRDFMGRNLADLAIAAYRRIAAARS
jgi:hypothetical protein